MSASFKDLRVWQAAVKFTVDVYKATSSFPKHELYGLTQQVRRAAVSVPSNIAEGKGHRSNREFGNFLLHARGSLLREGLFVRGTNVNRDCPRIAVSGRRGSAEAIIGIRCNRALSKQLD
jgi:hypothetical protein